MLYITGFNLFCHYSIIIKYSSILIYFFLSKKDIFYNNNKSNKILKKIMSNRLKSQKSMNTKKMSGAGILKTRHHKLKKKWPEYYYILKHTMAS
jgi:hypothetical protein